MSRVFASSVVAVVLGWSGLASAAPGGAAAGAAVEEEDAAPGLRGPVGAKRTVGAVAGKAEPAAKGGAPKVGRKPAAKPGAKKAHPHAGGKKAHPHAGGKKAHPHAGGKKAHPHAGGKKAHPHAGGKKAHPHAGGKKAHPHAGGKPQAGAPAAPRPRAAAPTKVIVKPGQPAGWAPGWHRTDAPHPAWHPDTWSRGVFVYSPPERPQSVQVVEERPNGSTARVAAPRRTIDRRGDLSVGLHAAGRVGVDAATLSAAPATVGAGLTGRYRLLDPLGLELSWSRTLSDWETPDPLTVNTLSASAQVFAFPWTRLSPYLSVGYSGERVRPSAAAEVAVARGPHAGLGLELALGQNAAIGAELRGTGLLPVGADADAGRRFGAQALAAFHLYF